MENYVNGAEFSCPVQRKFSCIKTNNTRCQWFLPLEAALAQYNDSEPSQPLQQQIQLGKLSAWIFADSSNNQLSVPINWPNWYINRPLHLHWFI